MVRTLLVQLIGSDTRMVRTSATWMVRTLQFRAFVTRMVGAVLVRAMRQEHVDRLTACLRGPWTASGGA